MKALILNNRVVDVQEVEFEVHSSMTWVDCDDTVQVGFSYDGSEFTSNEPTAEEIATKEAEQQAKEDLKASAKAKLIAGEALTEDEANILIGV
jgi:pyruvoyl-dependent arginine decarboxylase (PvlArgDC)